MLCGGRGGLVLLRQRRGVSLRSFDCLRPEWLFNGVPQAAMKDEDWYERTCLADPLMDPVSGVAVHVLGTSPLASDQDPVRRTVAALADASRGDRLRVAVGGCHSGPAVAAWARLSAAVGRGKEEQEAACDLVAKTGAAPDELAEALMQAEAYATEFAADSVAVVAEAQRRGVPLHYVARPPLQTFSRMAAVRQGTIELLQATPEDMQA
eukprot:Hpha_TRINITY_DN32628_c0_g1::TRINITY_DN32628_c0_g1_i1::g.30334::m.30334